MESVSGQNSAPTARKRDFSYAPETGLNSDKTAGPLRAIGRHGFAGRQLPLDYMKTKRNAASQILAANGSDHCVHRTRHLSPPIRHEANGKEAEDHHPHV